MNQLDLLLVNAPARAGVYGSLFGLSAIEPPVWAGLIATYCLARGFTVQILDAEAEGLSIEETAARIVEASPRLAAFCIYGHQPSASTQCLPAASAVCAAVKRMAKYTALGNPVPTIALGTHPSALPEKTLREEPFDFVCQGEGPLTIAPLISALRFQGNRVDLGGSWLVNIPGMKGKCQPFFKPAPNITDIDTELPSQAWELLDMKRYRAHGWHLWTANYEGPGFDSVQINGQQVMLGYHPTATPLGGYASVQTSLGCQFACEFCCIQAPFGDASPRMRYWSPENVVEQIRTLVQEYGIKNIKIPDEMFCFNRAHVKAICEGLLDLDYGNLAARLNIWAYARVDTVKDEAMLALMRRAGFRWLGIGVESGSKHVRDGVDKGRFGNEQIIAAVRRVQAAGICVGANYIFGLPDDTPESCEQTLAIACELNTEYANFYCAMAYPGSALHRTAQKKGWRLPEDPGGPGWIGYSQHAPESLPLRTEAMTAEEVLDFRDEAFLRYFTRPEYLEMMRVKFGDRVVNEIRAMTALGKPRRLHREK